MKNKRYKGMAFLCLGLAVVALVLMVVCLAAHWIAHAVVFAVIALVEAAQYCIWNHKSKTGGKSRTNFSPFSKRIRE